MLVTRCIPHLQMYITRPISIQVETASGNGRQWHSKIQDLAGCSQQLKKRGGKLDKKVGGKKSRKNPTLVAIIYP